MEREFLTMVLGSLEKKVFEAADIRGSYGPGGISGGISCKWMWGLGTFEKDIFLGVLAYWQGGFESGVLVRGRMRRTGRSHGFFFGLWKMGYGDWETGNGWVCGLLGGGSEYLTFGDAKGRGVV